MFIETKRTQGKLRDLLHEDLCPRRGCDYADGDQGTCWQRANRDAVILLGKLMPVISSEMFPLVRADERGRIAGELELPACCVNSGGIEPCQPNYFCPTVGEWESPCHGGFDTCCAHPDLHQTSDSKKEGGDDDHGGDRG